MPEQEPQSSQKRITLVIGAAVLALVVALAGLYAVLTYLQNKSNGQMTDEQKMQVLSSLTASGTSSIPAAQKQKVLNSLTAPAPTKPTTSKTSKTAAPAPAQSSLSADQRAKVLQGLSTH